MKDSLFQNAYLKTFVLILLAACIKGRGQEVSEGDITSDPAFIGTVLTEKSDLNTLKAPEIKKVSFFFSTGMMLGTTGYKNNFSAAYIAPSVAYYISPRIRVRAGCLLFFNSFYYPSVTSSQSGETPAVWRNNLALFIAADYFITDRMTLTGSYYKLPEDNLFRQRVAPEVYNRYNACYSVPSESMSLGLNYRIAKGLYLGAEIRFINNYRFSTDPYLFLPGNSPYEPLYW
jgi:hypothetical protein